MDDNNCMKEPHGISLNLMRVTPGKENECIDNTADDCKQHNDTTWKVILEISTIMRGYIGVPES